MPALETLVLYLVVGVGVAVVVALRRKEGMSLGSIAVVLGVVLFWPLLGPLLLSRSDRPPPPAPQMRTEAAQARLAAALASLDGLAGDVVAPEVTRVRTLTSSITAMEHRVTEMDAMLATPEFDAGGAEQAVQMLLDRGLAESDARVVSARGRLRNVARLRAIREQTAADLERVLLQIEEMSTQLKLLRLGSAGDGGEAVRIVRQVADGLQDLTDALIVKEQVVQ